METATRKSTRKGSSKKASTSSISEVYVNYLLHEGKRPASVFKFCSDIGIRDDDFYDQFGSFDGLERSIWKNFVTKTIDRLKADKSYHNFSAREKVLAFYFTFFEELKSYRSFVLVQIAQRRTLDIVPEFLKDFRKEYIAHLESVMKLGKSSGEVANRPYLDKRYPEMFWLHMAFLLMFWKEDNSPAFEQTDAAIEKSVNLAFDLIGKGAVDSVIDFAKFLYQSKTR